MKTFLRYLFVMLLLLSLSMSLAQQNLILQTIHSRIPGIVQRLGLVPIRQMDTTKQLELVIGLPLRNQLTLNKLLHEIYDPTSTQFHHFLTHSEFISDFGPSEQDYQAVIAFAKSNGFNVTRTYSDRMILDISGSVSTAEKILHVRMEIFKHPKENRDFFAPDAEPSINLSTPISSITGLSDYKIPQPVGYNNKNSNIKPTAYDGTGPNGSYIGNDFRAAYAPGVTLTGQGQKVGILEFNGGFYQSDIDAYDNLAGIRHVPIQSILLDGTTGANYSDTGVVAEVSLDIEMTNAMAPGLDSVIVYEGNYADDILQAMVQNTSIKQFSASWAFWTDGYSHTYFLELAAQGQSFFNASGDWDAWGSHDWYPYYPTINDTLVTIVGGTDLSTNGAGGSYSSETVYNFLNNTVGSGGGIDSSTPIPSYQQNINMSQNGGSTTYRNGPDVAMVATDIYVIFENGITLYHGNGTSYASPLWASFTALVNQQAASLGNPTVGCINFLIYPIAKAPLYSLAFHDVTTGNNELTPGAFGYNAVTGYDLCTGWGSPTGQQLINYLSNPLWSGTHILSSNYIVPSGHMLTILPGAQIQFTNGDSLIVNGVLNAQGTITNPIAFSNSSLIFSGSGASNSILNYVNINNGAGIQCLNTGNVTIENSILSYCTNGIYIYNSWPAIEYNQIIEPQQNGIYGQSSYSQTILNNIITKTSASGGYYHNYQGLYFYSNTPVYANYNDESGFYWGAYIGGGSNATLYDNSLSNPHPYNRFRDNVDGIGSAWGSTITATWAKYGGSGNSIYNNSSLDVDCYQSSYAYVQNTYWGGGEPKQYVDGSSYLIVDPVLTSDPWSGGLSPTITSLNSNIKTSALNKVESATFNQNPNQTLSGDDLTDINLGLQLENENQISQAISLYQSLISSGRLVNFSLTELKNIRGRHPGNNIEAYFQGLIKNANYSALAAKLLGDSYLQDGKFNDAMNAYDNVIQNYPGSYEAIDAKFDKLFAYLNIMQDRTSASNILNELKQMNLQDEELKMRLAIAENLISPNTMAKPRTSDKQANTHPIEFLLDNNYPNPFNPSTIIHYEIPSDGIVTLKVYDELGREVKTLVNQYQNKGRYDINFNASNLASGIYFYRLQSGSFISTKKMLLLK